MSDDFSSSISLLADLELQECSKCRKPTETMKLVNGLCLECQKKSRKQSAPIISDKKTSLPKTRKPRSSKTLKELETKIKQQQFLIETLRTKNEELESRTSFLMDRIQILEKETTPTDIHEKIVLAYYSHQKKNFFSYKRRNTF